MNTRRIKLNWWVKSNKKSRYLNHKNSNYKPILDLNQKNYKIFKIASVLKKWLIRLTLRWHVNIKIMTIWNERSTGDHLRVSNPYLYIISVAMTWCHIDCFLWCWLSRHSFRQSSTFSSYFIRLNIFVRMSKKFYSCILLFFYCS